MDKNKSFAAAFGAAFGFGAARAVDFALIGGSLATAFGAVGFAGYETLAGDHETHVNGLQYLAIFAQPSRHAAPAPAGDGLDMNPVGAIPSEKTAVNGYALVGAKESYAWLRLGNRIFAVRPGDDVDGLGHVAAIALRSGRWTLIDDNGAPLIVSALTEDGPSDGRRFDKRMILGGRP